MKPQPDENDIIASSVGSDTASVPDGDFAKVVDPQKAFEHLHKELVEYQLRFIDNGVRGAGLALLMIGWILTSESARSFIKTNNAGRWAAVAGIGVMVIAYILLAVRMIQVMQHLDRQLKALAYFPSAYYSFRVMPSMVAISIAALAITPAAIAIALILVAVR
ncbi:MAG TPA: hypothetical protein VJ276_07505 [Thermoanaerobaculia bacterium]|nr:hypothetical protein [Thermoanaerobaculia bacterium]